ncbi:MAG: carboxypeptidase regulatory-like domain-containing protein [Myxococcales bacterium]|nr:carboxypeptidase regulatory-like domain-containing protein [Myxococcales bacterium]
MARFELVAAFAVAALVATPQSAFAQQHATRFGENLDALPGALRVPLPVAPATLLAVSGGAGYAYTEPVLRQNDQHHRAFGSLAIAVRPLSWLAFALRFDGRYDAHTINGRSDDGIVGDPRIVLRAGGRVAGAFGLGAQASLWAPGASAPSIVPAAFSVDMQAFGGYVPAHGRVALVGRAGFRLDNSAQSAPNAAQLSASDRLSLGVSAFHAVLVGVAAVGRFGPVEPFAECTADILVGRDAPIGASPVHFVGGVRVHPRSSLHLHPGLVLDVSPSARASLAPGAPLTDTTPRVAVMFTLGVGFPSPREASPAERAAGRARNTATAGAGNASTTAGDAEGEVRDPSGAPVADAVVLVRRGEQTVLELRTDAQGHWRARGLASGDYSVIVRGASGAERSVPIRVGGSTAARAAVTIETVTSAAGAQLRGTVRSFNGSGVRATIRIVEANRTVVANEDGSFRIPVEPRSYTVEFSADGYQSQRRRVTVSDNGVVILNIDLRPRRGGRAP